MATIQIELAKPDYGFEAKDQSGHTVQFDVTEDHGGKNEGVRPMQGLLMCLGTCSGVDVVSILKKKRQTISSYKMTIHGEREQDKTPALWTRIHMIFILNGEIEEVHATQAIKLSVDKYCSVAETLRLAGAEITWELQLNK